jgi:hypothetical protein
MATSKTSNCIVVTINAVNIANRQGRTKSGTGKSECKSFIRRKLDLNETVGAVSSSINSWIALCSS